MEEERKIIKKNSVAFSPQANYTDRTGTENRMQKIKGKSKLSIWHQKEG
jgi:hypothetical protein